VTARGWTIALGVAAAWVSASACAMDFDRFDPAEGGREAHGSDASSTTTPPPSGHDAAAASFDGGAPSEADANLDFDSRPRTGQDGGGQDAGADAQDASNACGAPSACVMTAHSCGSSCEQTLQQCLRICGGNNACTRCNSQAQSCTSRCVGSCTACAADAGCSDNGECNVGLDASRGG